MARKGDPAVLKYVVAHLRFHAGMSQEKFGEKARISQSDISLMEAGKLAPKEEQLRRMAGAADVDWSLVVHARRFFAAALASTRRRGPAVGGRDLRFKPAIVQPGLLAEIPLSLEEWAAEEDRQPPTEALRAADEVWQALEPFPMQERQRRLGFSLRASRSWALAVRLCHESERAAAHSTKEALELAELALAIAKQAEGDEGFRAALQGYCWIYIGNARRVANDFDGADADFARAANLRKAGADPEGLLPGWRMLDREASLRREQHRFAEALTLLDQAVEAQGIDTVAIARLLVMKANIFQQMCDFKGAVVALEQAAAKIAVVGDEHLLFAHRFNTAANLVYLERYAEAARWMPEVRSLAEKQRKRLDLNRVLWLEAKTMAGLGQKQVAMERLEQAQRVFTAEELPYDAALSGLDLAVLWLEAGRAKEVAQMAVAMEWIFRHQGIEREALAALKLFCEAAKHEVATADLTRKVIADIEKVKRSAPRPD